MSFRTFRRDRERAGLTIEKLSEVSGLSVTVLERLENRKLWTGVEAQWAPILDEAYAKLESLDREKFNEAAANIVRAGMAISIQPLDVHSSRTKHYRVEIASEQLKTSGVGATAVGHGWTPYVALSNAQIQLDSLDADVRLALRGETRVDGGIVAAA
ncbi:helix-turn-helix transcriptional regulator [Mesorhizobium sp. BR1-1-3]|uniref:helix-turn-helix domain-containing protein n=1 Tax=Mesorhizobium sp. BR1-1-3 TaxID=2876651 RepID=UPI001CD04915|nr:helix-turn-helix transcriptional regulator [Mesorhizobium sp. BR1-1-3]MBZ9888162.1 helix-turn-helix transcriptional regulator [Mesorhizobium sp. BR1-1-3]